MDKTTLGGKPYNTLGSSDSNLILKTRGDLKILWGNKFIDLIKNGKIALQSYNFISVVSDIDLISDNGIYVIKDSEEVYVSINGIKINLKGENNTSYISFLIDLPHITTDLKHIALKNIGFYYESMDEAKKAEINVGIIYIEEEQKLYIANKGQLSEYLIMSESNDNNVFSSITIGKMEIYEENGSMKISSPDISLIVNNKECLDIGLDITVSSNINVKDLCFIQSYGASASSGFRLYTINGKSVLEVDSIIERNSTDSTTILDSSDIYSKHNNIITNAIYDSGSVICYLKYFNLFEAGQDVFIYLEDAIVLTVSYNNNNTVVVLCSDPVTEQTLVQVTVNNTNYTINIPLGGYSGYLQIGSTIESISNYKILKGPKNARFEGSYLYKKIPVKFNVKSIGDNYIVVTNEDEDFTSKCINALVCLASEPYIQIENNILSLIEKLEDEEEELVNTLIGVINEEEIESLKQCPELLETPKTGIYSNNFIGLNPKLYDSVFKKRCDYPKYDPSITLPETVIDLKYDLVVPNIAWIKELIKYAIPSGTIVMYNGKSSIPEGWVICDGNNGTPNLVGKFVKAVSSFQDVGDNNTDLDNENKLLIREENLPPHSHPHSAHSHNITSSSGTGSSGSLSMTSSDTFAYSLSKTSVVKSVSGVEGISTSTTDVYNDVSWRSVQSTGGSHTHSISSSSSTLLATSLETNKTWTNRAIKVEPHSYSLIFIMKL